MIDISVFRPVLEIVAPTISVMTLIWRIGLAIQSEQAKIHDRLDKHGEKLDAIISRQDKTNGSLATHIQSDEIRFGNIYRSLGRIEGRLGLPPEGNRNDE